MARGIADGIDAYFNTVEPAITTVGEHLADLTSQLEKNYTDPLEQQGELWAIAAMDLKTQPTAQSMPNSPCSLPVLSKHLSCRCL
mgnify:CR=1 FL=1